MVSHALGMGGSIAGPQGSASQVSSSQEQLPLLQQDPCGAGFVAIAREFKGLQPQPSCQQPACLQAAAPAARQPSSTSSDNSTSNSDSAELANMLSAGAAATRAPGTSNSCSSSQQSSPAAPHRNSGSDVAAAGAFDDVGGDRMCRSSPAARGSASSADDAGSYAEDDEEEAWASGSRASSSDTFSEVGDPAATEVVYVREGVAVWPSRTRRILGRLSLVKQHAVLFMAWLPYSTPPAAVTPAAPGSSASVAADVQQQTADHVQQPEQQQDDEQQTQKQKQQPLADPSIGNQQQRQQQQQQQQGDLEAEQSADVSGVLQSCDDEPEQSDSTWLEQQRQQQEEDTDRFNLPVPLASPRQQQGPITPAAATSLAASAATAATAAAGTTASGSISSSSATPSNGNSARDGRSSSSSVTNADAGRSLYAIHPIPLSDMKALVKHTPPLGVHQLTVVLNSGLTLPPLHFHNGGLRELIAALRQHGSLVKAAGDSATYLVNDTADPLQRCLLALDVADIVLGAPPPGASCVQAPAGLELQLRDGTGVDSVLGWQAVDAAAAEAAGAVGDESDPSRHAGSSSNLFGLGASSRARLSAAATAAAAAAAAAVSGAGSPALPHLPWAGFGIGYAGGSSYGWGQHAAGSGPVAETASGEDDCGVFGEGSSSAFPGGMHGSSTAWSGLRGKLKSQLNSTLSRVGQLAVDGASSLVAAAMDSWHAEAMRHFEEEVELYAEWSETQQQQQQQQQQGRQLQDQRLQSTVAAAAATADPADVHSSSTGSAAAAAGSSSSSSNSNVQPRVAAAATPAAGFDAASIAAAEAVDIIAAAAAGCTASPAAAAAATADVDTDLGAFELLEEGAAGPTDQLAAVRARAAPPPLSLEELGTFLDGTGRLVDESGFRERIFQAGIEASARKEAWKFLLGVYPPGSTAEQREQQRLRQQQQYALLKGQWAAVGPEQARRWGKWRERRSRIDKDVARTDRLHPFYRGRDASQHLAGLRDVLRCYCLFNWDLGYCQGMSDLASPLLVVMQGDEVDAFWCFVGLMERMGGNFAQDQAGMHTQLAALRQLVQVLDPQLHALFEARECLNYFFAFRWLLIHFKREFPFDQVLCLWECCWACPLTPHLHLYLAAAVLIQHRRLLLADAALDFDGLLRFCVELSGRLDLSGCLRLAEALVLIAGQAGAELLAGLP